MDAAGKVVSKLMREQDCEEGERERPSKSEAVRMGEEPGPGPEVVVRGEDGTSAKEVAHETGADGGGGENTEREQKKRNAKLTQPSAAGCPGRHGVVSVWRSSRGSGYAGLWFVQGGRSLVGREKKLEREAQNWEARSEAEV